jgi:hypothetical protein
MVDQPTLPEGKRIRLMQAVAWALAENTNILVSERFDTMLSEACFQGEVTLAGRRLGATAFEDIPYSYFVKPRGFSSVSGDMIAATPTSPSLETIFAAHSDAKWLDVIVEREQFLAWFARRKFQILGTAEADGTATRQVDAQAIHTGAPAEDLSKAAARREWDAELALRNADPTRWRTEKEDVRYFVGKFTLLDRDTFLSWRRGSRTPGRPRKD